MPSEGRFIGVKHSPEEIISQGLRYQVPEQIVILDFWTKIKRDRYGQALEKSSSLRSSNTLRGETPQTDETFDLSDSSSLTSMEATPEPPLTAASGGDHPIASTSSADVEMEIEAKGNANGSVPLKRLSSSHRSDREGTDVSQTLTLLQDRIIVLSSNCIYPSSTCLSRSQMVIHQILMRGKQTEKRQISSVML